MGASATFEDFRFEPGDTGAEGQGGDPFQVGKATRWTDTRYHRRGSDPYSPRRGRPGEPRFYTGCDGSAERLILPKRLLTGGDAEPTIAALHR